MQGLKKPHCLARHDGTRMVLVWALFLFLGSWRYGQSFQGHKFTQMFQSILCGSAQYKFNLTHKLLAQPKRTTQWRSPFCSLRFRHVVIEPSLCDYTNNNSNNSKSRAAGNGHTQRTEKAPSKQRASH